jgi:hypothetical protein
VIAWYAAMHSPAEVERLAILNAPHPAAYERELRSLSSQILRSAYALFFQLPSAAFSTCGSLAATSRAERR